MQSSHLCNTPSCVCTSFWRNYLSGKKRLQWRRCWGEANWEEKIMLSCWHRRAVQCYCSTDFNTSMTYFSPALPSPPSPSWSPQSICNRVFTSYIQPVAWEMLWWLTAGVICPQSRISHEQEAVCGRPALFKYPSPGRQQVLQPEPWPSSIWEHLSFTLALLHILESAAAAGGSGGCREGWFVINTPNPPPTFPSTSSASLRRPWLFLHPLLVSSWLHAVQKSSSVVAEGAVILLKLILKESSLFFFSLLVALMMCRGVRNRKGNNLITVAAKIECFSKTFKWNRI